MVADPILIARLHELLDRFNRKSMDLPDGLFDRRTQFLLNGTPYDAMLGRAPDDPLVLMIARGAAGYRFAMKALQHALPDAHLQLPDSSGPLNSGDTVALSLRLSGHARGTGEPIDTLIQIGATLHANGAVVRAEATADAAVVDILREARLRD
jgi:hypothetical protein